MSFPRKLVFTVAASLFLLESTGAAPIFVDNFSFEDPALSDGQFTRSDTIPGWTVSGGGGNSGVWNTPAGTYPAGFPSNGDQVGWSAGPVIAQILGESLAADTDYLLEVEVGTPSQSGGRINPGYRIQLLAGGIVLDEDSGFVDFGTFVTSQVAYTASSGDPQLSQSLEIRLSTIDEGGATGEADFDNVRLTATSLEPPLAIAEPAALLLMTAGILALAVSRKREHDEPSARAVA